MRGALIHGVLLAVMLVYGYRTWTRDKTVKPDLGAVVLWDKAEADLVALELKSDKKIVRLDRRGEGGASYWWGTETTIEKKPKPPETKPPEPGAGSGSAAGSGAGSAAKPGAGSGSAVAAGSAAGSGSAARPDPKAGSGAGSGSAVANAGSGAGSGSAAGSGAGSGSAATPPPVVAMEEVKKTTEFPLGEAGTKLLDGYVKARAIRDLGVPTDALKKEYKLDTATATLTVTFRDNTKRTFLVGGSVFDTSNRGDRYVMDQQSNKGYVLSKEIVGDLELGRSSLSLKEPRGFEPSKLEAVVIEAGGKTKNVARIQTTSGDAGQQVKTWGDPETKKANITLATFVDNTANLKPSEYLPNLKIESLTPVMKVTYKDATGGKLGTLSLYKGEKPVDLPEDTELDPANPPRGEIEYYIVTEKTRVPGLVLKDTAQRAEQDLPIVFSDKPPDVKLPDPKNSPFGKVPTGAHGGATPPGPPGPHGGATPPAPHGGAAAPPAPHGGAAPPALQGGAAPPTPPAPPGGATPPAPRGGAAPAPHGAAPATPPTPPKGAPATPATPAPPKGAPAKAADDGHGH